MGRTALELPTTFHATQRDRTIRRGSMSDASECLVLGTNIRDKRPTGQQVFIPDTATATQSKYPSGGRISSPASRGGDHRHYLIWASRALPKIVPAKHIGIPDARRHLDGRGTPNVMPKDGRPRRDGLAQFCREERRPPGGCGGPETGVGLFNLHEAGGCAW